ncbi:MAG: hypothetical protein OEY24_01040 [Candidatus Bathyarchaeota archaeon]|nr:hypothetical protein [Candidatus Bathyarchaeota archaeon]MDH5494279.1 hypothetical protein [Candidatus Bathyarchaeota archaeon]
MEMEEIAKWAYIIFLVIAIVAGLAIGYMAFAAHETGGFSDPDVENTNGYVILIMLILGIIIGLTSITTKEVTPFLIATIALMVAGAGGVWDPLLKIEALQVVYYIAAAITSYIAAFAAPAAVIIAVKAVLAMAKEK